MTHATPTKKTHSKSKAPLKVKTVKKPVATKKTLTPPKRHTTNTRSRSASKKSVFTLPKKFLQYVTLEAVLVVGITVLISSTGLVYVLAVSK